MTNLKGTTKQVAWAEGIRDSKLTFDGISEFWAEWNALTAEFLALYEGKEDSLQEMVAEAATKATTGMGAALARLTNSTSAKFWINNQHINLSKMVQNEEEFPQA